MGLFDLFKKKEKVSPNSHKSEANKTSAVSPQDIVAKQENLLFWAPAIYDGDPLTLPEPDYEIHVFPAAAQMIVSGVKIQADSALPEGYDFAQKASGKVLHLRTVRNPQLSKEAVPLFTDPNLLLQLFTPNTRISIVDYNTAKRFALQDKNICSGIVINPGRDNKMISISQLEQEAE